MEIQKMFSQEQLRFGERVAELRKSIGITQEALGKRCRISRTEISRIENGSKNLEFLSIIKLAKGFGIELSSLFDYDNLWPLRKSKGNLDINKRTEKEKIRFGKRVKQIRENKGIIQIDIDVTTGIPDSDVSRIENAIGNVKFYSVFRIAKALKVSTAELFNYKGALPK